MFGFSKNNGDRDALVRKLGRLLNVYHKLDLEYEQTRSDSRIRLAIPCVMFPASEMRAPTRYALGVTVDISLCGLGLVTLDTLAGSGDYVLAFGPKDLRIYILATLKRVGADDFGAQSVAFSFKRILTPKEQATISATVAAIEQGPAQSEPGSQPSNIPSVGAPNADAHNTLNPCYSHG